MNKLIRNGKVALLVSPGFGAGWYTWHQVEELLYDPKVVEMIEAKSDLGTILEYCENTYGQGIGKYIYLGGLDKLEVQWLPVGTLFLINEFGGSESLQLEEQMKWMVA